MLAARLTIDHWMQFLARGLVGLLFIISAGLKIISPADSASFFNSFLPTQPALVSVLTFILSLFELLLGAMLLFAVKLHYAAILSCLFFLVATILGVIFLDATGKVEKVWVGVLTETNVSDVLDAITQNNHSIINQDGGEL